MRVKQQIATIVTTAALLVVPATCGATVVLFQNPSADLTSDAGFTNPNEIWAENFVLGSQSNVEQFSFTASHDSSAAASTTVVWSITTNTTNGSGDDVPDTTVAALRNGSTAITLVPNFAAYIIDIPDIELSAGTTYWLTLHLDGTPGDPGWALAQNDGGASGSAYSTNNGTDWLNPTPLQDAAFSIEGTVVPAPATVGLLGLGLALLGARRRVAAS